MRRPYPKDLLSRPQIARTKSGQPGGARNITPMAEPAEPYAAVVLAGGSGRRIGGPAKPALPIGGRPMLHRVLAAVDGATPRIVVGHPELPLPPGTIRTQEWPPGGGPLAGTAAGLALVPPGVGYVALLAADLPLLTAAAVRQLRRAAIAAELDGALFVDGAGQPQWLCGVWRTGALRARLAALAGGPAGRPLRELLAPLPVARVTASGAGPAPWWDCDTDADLRRAEELAMTTLDDWTVAACAALDLDAAEANAHQRLILDLARDAARAVERPAAPITTFLLGLAVGRGADPAEAAATLTALTQDH
jgi:molybdopterin-guanine dinucleotide biosynthesis protein A